MTHVSFFLPYAAFLSFLPSPLCSPSTITKVGINSKLYREVTATLSHICCATLMITLAVPSLSVVSNDRCTCVSCPVQFSNWSHHCHNKFEWRALHIGIVYRAVVELWHFCLAQVFFCVTCPFYWPLLPLVILGGLWMLWVGNRVPNRQWILCL